MGNINYKEIESDFMDKEDAIYLNKRIRIRTFIVILFSMLSIVFTTIFTYLLNTDKNNININWVLTLSLIFMVLTIGNLIVLLILIYRKKHI